MIIFSNFDRVINLNSFPISYALNTQVALASIFYLYSLAKLIEVVNFSWALGYELLPLSDVHLRIDFILIESHSWLLVHNTGSDR